MMSNKKILIIDDHGDLRKLVRMTLAFGGYELHEAEDGQQGLSLANVIQPKVIILDVMMPGSSDGYDVCHKIKLNPATQDIFVILLTARGQKKDIEQGGLVGADSYLVKPFSPLELIENVNEGMNTIETM